MPGDTKETIQKTIQFVKEIDSTTATFGICTPYAGTALFEQVSREHPELGDGSACDMSKIHTKCFFNQYYTDLTPEELESYVKKAYSSFYMRPIYILKRLWRIKSPGELMRVMIAASQVFSFAVEK
jgi:radical SAM superfamily enzyme YgiQ (UPF0313 family)